MNKQLRSRSEHDLNPNRERVLQVADLHGSADNSFHFVPSRADLAQLAKDVSAVRISNVRFFGGVLAESPEDWRLKGRLAATITQQCVVSLEPVRTKIDVELSRRFLADRTSVYPDLDCPVPEDDSTELLTESIDLFDIVREMLLLELPTYPRLNDAVAPGFSDTDPCPEESRNHARPFSVLSEFRDRMAR